MIDGGNISLEESKPVRCQHMQPLTWRFFHRVLSWQDKFAQLCKKSNLEARYFQLLCFAYVMTFQHVFSLMSDVLLSTERVKRLIFN